VLFAVVQHSNFPNDGIYYRLGLITASGFMLYQQWIIRGRERASCFKAFLNNHYVGLSVLIGLVLEFVLA